METAPEHVAQVRSLIFDNLTPRQVAQLDDICATILERIGAEDPHRAELLTTRTAAVHRT